MFNSTELPLVETTNNFSLGSVNDTPNENRLTSGPPVHMIVIGIFTAPMIPLNALVALFFGCRKSLRRMPFNFQLLVLSNTDVLVGITAYLGLAVYLIPDIPTFFCGFSIALFLTLQLSGLSIVLGICIQRMIVISSGSKFVSQRKKKYFLLHCIVTSVVCPTIMGVVFIKYKVPVVTLTSCDIKTYFGNSRRSATLPIQICFVMMQLSTDFFYTWLWVRFFGNVRQSVKVHNTNNTKDISLSKTPRITSIRADDGRTIAEGSRCSTSGVGSRTTLADSSRRQSTSMKMQGSSKARLDSEESKVHIYSHRLSVPVFPFSPSAELNSLNKSNNRGPDERPPRLMFSSRRKTNQSTSTALNNSTLGLKLQRKSLVTIGILLLLYNVCLSPLTVSFLRDIFAHYEIPREELLAFTGLMTVNSSMNFFVYALRSPELRAFLWESWRKVWTRGQA